MSDIWPFNVRYKTKHGEIFGRVVRALSQLGSARKVLCVTVLWSIQTKKIPVN